MENKPSPAPLNQVVGQLRKLLRECTPGRWVFHRDRDGDPWVMPEPRGDHGAVVLPYNAHHEESDAQLIIAMHGALPALLAIAEAAHDVQDGMDKRDEDEAEWAAAGTRVSAMEMHNRRMRLARALAALPNPEVSGPPSGGSTAPQLLARPNKEQTNG